jgi:uncharacterized protein YoxC
VLGRVETWASKPEIRAQNSLMFDDVLEVCKILRMMDKYLDKCRAEVSLSVERLENKVNFFKDEVGILNSKADFLRNEVNNFLSKVNSFRGVVSHFDECRTEVSFSVERLANKVTSFENEVNRLDLVIREM